MASSQMIALLGLLAVAGYQNRDKLGALLGGMTGAGNAPSPASGGGTIAAPGGGLGGLLGNLGGMLGGSAPGAAVTGGLGELINQFTNAGHGETARSWVETGPNRDVTTDQLEQALGADTVATLTQQTGLTREELLSRLRTVLPSAVDKLTPDGRLPTSDEASRMVRSS